MQNIPLTSEATEALGAARLAESGHPPGAAAPEATEPAVDPSGVDSKEHRDDMTGDGHPARSPLEVERSAVAEAEAMARTLAEAGYPGDFDVSNLASLDDLINNNWTDGRPTPGGFFDPPHRGPIWTPDLQGTWLGFYLGETLRRRYGGQWRSAPLGDPIPLCPVLQLPNGLSTNPILAVGIRMGGGPSVSEYAASVFALAEGKTLDENPAHCHSESLRPPRIEKIGTIDVIHFVEGYARSAADWLSEKGLPADYDQASLDCLDQFITDNGPDWGPMWKGDLQPEYLPHAWPVLRRVLGLGCYIGEALRRQHGGKWYWDESENPLWLRLEFPNSAWVAPVWAVVMRAQTGCSVASFVEFAAASAGVQAMDNAPNGRSS